jgi:hypothetical protein
MEGYEESFVYNGNDIRLDSSSLEEAMPNLSLQSSPIELIEESNSIKELLPKSFVELEEISSTKPMPTPLTALTAKEDEQKSLNLKYDSLPLQEAFDSVHSTEEPHDMSIMKNKATPPSK